MYNWKFTKPYSNLLHPYPFEMLLGFILVFLVFLRWWIWLWLESSEGKLCISKLLDHKLSRKTNWKTLPSLFPWCVLLRLYFHDKGHKFVLCIHVFCAFSTKIDLDAMIHNIVRCIFMIKVTCLFTTLPIYFYYIFSILCRQ